MFCRILLSSVFISLCSKQKETVDENSITYEFKKFEIEKKNLVLPGQRTEPPSASVNPPYICITKPSPLHSRSDVTELCEIENNKTNRINRTDNLRPFYLKSTAKNFYAAQNGKFLSVQKNRTNSASFFIISNPYNQKSKEQNNNSMVIILNQDKTHIIDVQGVLEHGLVSRRPIVWVPISNMLDEEQRQLMEYNYSRKRSVDFNNVNNNGYDNDGVIKIMESDPFTENNLDHQQEINSVCSDRRQGNKNELNIVSTTHIWRLQNHSNGEYVTLHCFNDDSLVLQVVNQKILTMPFKINEIDQHFLFERN